MSARRTSPNPLQGIGLDIVEIRRIQQLAKRNRRFLTRVFSKDEIAYCRAKKKSWQHFAVRFAAKEAVWKALGSSNLTLPDITVVRDKNGRPRVKLLGRKAPKVDFELSLSHSDLYAMAVAVAVRKR